MAKNFCTFIPSKGKNLFNALKKQFGYSTARDVFLRAINPKFIDKYKKNLSLDEEGVPSYESLMNNSYMKKFIGEAQMINGLNKQYPSMEDTIENYSNLVESAYQFNTTNSQRDDFVATVDYTDDGKIKVAFHKKSDDALKKFKEQYSSQKLNEKLVELFRPLGVTVGLLSQEEVKAGRIGVTDFSIARNIATGFTSMIKVANNMEGAMHLSEEFAHLLVGIFRDQPLMQRAIDTLKNNEDALRQILGNEYEDTIDFQNGDMEKVAEEALGKILQKNLSDNEEKISTPAPSLFQRLMNWIVKQFKGYNANDVQDVIDYTDSLMSSVMENILNGTRQITKEDISKSQREAQFNALSDRIERNIQILKEGAKTEAKRYKISKTSKNKNYVKTSINEILEYTKEDADTVEGLFNYSKQALNNLRNLDALFSALDTMTPEQKFRFLRNVRSYIQSYAGFIKSLNDAIIEDEAEEDNMFLRDFTFNGEPISIQEVLADLNNLSEQLSRKYTKTAFPAFTEFLKPFLGDEIVVPFGRYAGTRMSAEELIAEAQKDISFMDRWLDSMADSSDVVLQAYDAAVKDAKDKARLKTIDDIQKIRMFREEAENMGITDFDWMFEYDNEGHKTGNYISEINYGQFEKDLKEFTQQLDEKYGKNPSGEQAMAKIAEREAWLEAHSTTYFGTYEPNPLMYRNKAYDNLTSNQREILDKFMDFKIGFDEVLPESKVSANKAIQMRKAGNQRLWQSISSPSTIYQNIKGAVANTFLEQEDDDQLHGVSAKGLTDFAGNEFLMLPVLYTNRLKNPDELNTDIFGTLMSYAYMANQYHQMDEVIDPLEIGYSLLTETRKVRKTKGNKKLEEQFRTLNLDVTNKIFQNESNIKQKLDDFRESQIYGKYLKDEGTFFGSNVSVNKTTSFILKMSSLAQLGVNWLANMANVATGTCMQRIEAAAGQFFNFKELRKADSIYRNELLPMMSELGSRNKTNKLDLFYELFDVKQDFGDRLKKRTQTKNFLQRLFGADIAFMGQYAGDHWLYGRTAIAMALREKVKLNDKEMSLWDALQVENVKNDSDVKKLNYRQITDLDGNPFNVAEFSRRVAHINQVCFGIYNDDDANAANRVAMGRLLQQYRKWMKIQFSRRFQAGQMNLATHTWEEGYYITIGRILQQLKRGEIQLSAVWDKIKDRGDEEGANLRRALTELAQFFAVWALANIIDWPDDKHRPYALKLAEYSAKRLAHELGGLAPSLTMPQELLKTVRSPIPSATVVQDIFNLVKSSTNPADWFDEMKSGPYKGMSTWEKNFLKAPIPGVSQYRQVDRFIGQLDNSINYYARPY